MDNQKRILSCCKIAVRKGFGTYLVARNMTWKELLVKLEKGYKLDKDTEKSVEISIDLMRRNLKLKEKRNGN
jgi:hypothetical protein